LEEERRGEGERVEREREREKVEETKDAKKQREAMAVKDLSNTEGKKGGERGVLDWCGGMRCVRVLLPGEAKQSAKKRSDSRELTSVSWPLKLPYPQSLNNSL